MKTGSDRKNVMQPIVAMESLLIKCSNGETYVKGSNLVQESVFQNDLDFQRLEKQLTVLVDVIHEGLPAVKKITSVRTICEAMKTHAYKTLLSGVHKLLRLYLTVPITPTQQKELSQVYDVC